MSFSDPAISKTEGLFGLVITQLLIVVLKEVFSQALVRSYQKVRVRDSM